MNATISIQVPKTMIGMNSIEGIADLVKMFNPQKTMVVTDKGLASLGLVDKVTDLLKQNDLPFDIFDECEPNAPSDIIEACSNRVVAGDIDLLIGFGGGSVMDTAKAVSVTALNPEPIHTLFTGFVTPGPDRQIIPTILIPTTSGSGSEWSQVAMVSDKSDGYKKGLKGPALSAAAVIIDPSLTLGLPYKITAETGVDALVHAIETYSHPRLHMLSEMFAETAVKAIVKYLPKALADGTDSEARSHMSIAAALSIKAMTLHGAGLAHFIDGFVISKGHVCHGEALAILIPHVMAFNAPVSAGSYARLAKAMGVDINGLSSADSAEKAIAAVKTFTQDVGMPQRLSEIGITEQDLPEMAEGVMTVAAVPIKMNSPVDVSVDDILKILRNAF